MLAVDPYLVDWLDLVFRWFHVTAGIVWIGTSFYFVALDNHLEEPAHERDRERGVGGEAWEIHGGGFYRVEKYRVAPQRLPEPLHWFKWEAYWTWISGFTLFVVLYYLQPRTYLIDPTVANLAPWQAIAISLGGLALALGRLRRPLPHDPQRARCSRVLVLGGVVATAYGASRLFARAGGVPPGRRDARDDHGRERLLRHHPRAARAHPREEGRSRARSRRRTRAASVGPCTTTTSRCRCCSRCSPATSRSRTGTRTAGSSSCCLMVDRRVIRALLQQPACGPDALVDPARRRHRARRPRESGCGLRRRPRRRHP